MEEQHQGKEAPLDSATIKEEEQGQQEKQNNEGVIVKSDGENGKDQDTKDDTVAASKEEEEEEEVAAEPMETTENGDASESEERSSKKRRRVQQEDTPEPEARETKRSILRPRLSTHVKPGQASEDSGLEVDLPGENFPIRHPRYDNDWYQAPIPDLVKEKPIIQSTPPSHRGFESLDRMNLRDAQVDLNDKMVWGGTSILREKKLSENELDEFLLFCRRLTREIPPQGSHFIRREMPDEPTLENGKRARRAFGTSGKDCFSEFVSEAAVALRPLESDELALEFLHQCDYDVEQAKFMLLSSHGVGVETEIMGVQEKANRRGKVSDQLFSSVFGETVEEGDGLTNGDVVEVDIESGDSLRKWSSATKAALAGRPTIPTRNYLYSLQEAFSKLKKDRVDVKLLGSAKDVSVQLAKKLSAVDEWIAHVHDALSLIKPDLHWTLDELKELIGNMPSGVKLAEEAQVKRVYEKCAALQAAVKASLEQVTPVKVLAKLLSDAKHLPIDLHELSQVEERISKSKSFAQHIRTLIPCTEMWSRQSVLGKRGQNSSQLFKSKDWTPHKLPELIAYRDKVLAELVTFREVELLDHYIQKAQGWIETQQSALTDTVDVKLLLEVSKQVETIPVDLSEEKEQVDEQLRRAKDCIARVRSAVPKQNKTRGAVEVQKMEIETLRSLRDEAALIGVEQDEIQEMEVLLQEADDWKAQAINLLKDVDAVDIETLESVLNQVADIPVIMIEEEMLRAQLRCKECCRRIYKALDDVKELEVLVKLQSDLQSIRKEISSLTGQSLSKTNQAGMCEAALREVISNAQNWISQVNFVCRSDVGEVPSNPGRPGKKKKKKQKAKKKLHEPFAANERITFQTFAELYGKGKNLKVDTSRYLGMLRDLELSLQELRIELVDCLTKANQPEVQTLLLETDTEKLDPDLDEPALPMEEEEGDKKDTTADNKTNNDNSVASNDGVKQEPEGSKEYERGQAGNSNAVKEEQLPVESNHAMEVDLAKDKSFTLADLESRLDKCMQYSVITREETYFRAALDRSKQWMANVLQVCPALESWEGLTQTSDGLELGRPTEAPSLELLEKLVETSQGLFIDVSEPKQVLDETLLLTKGWVLRATEIYDKYSETLERLRLQQTQVLADKQKRKKKEEGGGEGGGGGGGANGNSGNQEKVEDDSMSVASSVDSVRRSKRESTKKRKSSQQAENQLLDQALGLLPMVEEDAHWAAVDASLEDQVVEVYGENVSVSNELELSKFALKPPVDFLDAKDTDLSAEMQKEVQRQHKSYSGYSDELNTIVLDARNLLLELRENSKSTVAQTLPQVKRVIWIAEASSWIELVQQLALHSKPLDLDQLRILIAQGMSLLDGEYVRYPFLNSSMEEVAGNRGVDWETSYGITLGNSVKSSLPVGGSGFSVDEIEFPPQESQQGSSDGDVEMANKDKSEEEKDKEEERNEAEQEEEGKEDNHKAPRVQSLGRCVERLVRRLQWAGRSVMAWEKVTKKRVGQMKTMENLVGVKILVDLKRAQGVFPTCESEQVVQEEVNRIHTWLTRARRILFSNKLTDAEKPTLEEMDKMVSEANKFKVAPPEMKEARASSRTAKAWVLRLKKSGIEKGEASRELLKDLLTEAAKLPIRLSEHTRVLAAATRVFCLCHRPFNDVMIECTYCSEWFHIKCVGLANTQAKKTTRYCCPACSLKRTAEGIQGLAKSAVVRTRLARWYLERELSKGKELDPGYVKELQSFFSMVDKCAPLLESPAVADNENLFAQQVKALGLPAVFRDYADGAPIHKALAFKGWVGKALSVFGEQLPTLDSLQQFLNDASKEDEFIARNQFVVFVKGLIARVHRWSTQAQSVLHANPSVSSQEVLKECSSLLETAKLMPVVLPEEKSLLACVDDGAHRYCICHGFNDGDFMISCDGCLSWLHGRCVNLTQQVGETLDSYLCPNCAQKRGEPYKYGVIQRPALLPAGNKSAP